MFQDFTISNNTAQSSTRIAALRDLLRNENLDGYIVPLSDEHQSEYTASYAKRLEWLTSFTGSCGLALILLDKAIFFTDGRYNLQIRQQTDNNIFTYIDSTKTSFTSYLEQNIYNLKIAMDPALFTISQAKTIKAALRTNDCSLTYPDINFIDKIWTDQPAKPTAPIYLYDINYSGKEAQQKIAELQKFMQQNGHNNLMLTDLTSIAWLFNIRGNDVGHTPIALSFAYLTTDEKPILFIDSNKLTFETTSYLKTICRLMEIDALAEFLLTKANDSFTLDPDGCSEQIYSIINSCNNKVTFITDPIKIPKATKNEIELVNIRQAHLCDGVAMVNFLYWLAQQQPNSIDEITSIKKLEDCRKKAALQFNMELKDIAFDTISGAAEHGAIIHYRVNENSNKIIPQNSLYLIDSGAQYLHGTTDITRTIAIGNVGNEEKKFFTLVLKGMINLSMAKFLPHSKGMHLDILARQALLQHGVDYAHGTGHGVGCYLGVHEGPQAITRSATQELLPNMIISNEPGYYKEGHFGIRIENLLKVNAAKKIDKEEIATHAFETLTLCPIDINLINPIMLTKAELTWLNNYHKNVYTRLSPYLTEDTKIWLQTNTKAV